MPRSVAGTTPLLLATTHLPTAQAPSQVQLANQQLKSVPTLELGLVWSHPLPPPTKASTLFFLAMIPYPPTHLT
ncbi:hypothetical protein F4860DRAFT_367452 [Xylaria cubensis]|nr:hypothetical protein F4860DRAFT_367452 [Xylaria cubensis]